ncbi:DUF3618 domain-containing protein [Kineosporia sp. J2-2]|uniref:DUF3618 domain-containing protein n=1 Tax=Kineosporia corallincola TaxID=2835133 RepID=A0ABS5TEU2_9ACTN|nr:DUF3618 domain-containing protein [Kineosporia corallincola]MBT0769612.1 DUF3618 domain-containing protein [Kineosporia corallincola]
MSDDNGSRDTEQIRAEIDHTRDELADTVEALAAKTDVKGRATQKAHEVQETTRARVQTLQETAKHRAQEAQESAKVHAMAAKVKVTEQTRQVTEQARQVGEQARIKGEAVAGQAKVKSEQARLAATERAHSAQETVQQQRQDRPWLLPALGAAAGLLTGALVWLRRRRNR